MSFGQPPPGGGGFGPPPGDGGFGQPPGGGGFGQPPGGGFGPPPGGGFGPSPSGPGGDPFGGAPPGGIAGGAPQNDPLALASLGTGAAGLLLSFVSFCCCIGYLSIPLALAAIGTGVFSLQRQKKDPAQFGGKNFAFAGIALGGVTLLAAIVIIVLSLVVGFGGSMMQELNR
jgi:hypothetical protein